MVSLKQHCSYWRQNDLKINNNNIVLLHLFKKMLTLNFFKGVGNNWKGKQEKSYDWGIKHKRTDKQSANIKTLWEKGMQKPGE